jgi:hypothetical protein
MLRRDFVDVAEFIVDRMRILLINRKEFRNGAHEIRTVKVVASQVILKFIKTVLER